MTTEQHTGKCTFARRVLVTGASRGIGAAVARRLLNAGHHVVGVSRSAPQAHEQLHTLDWHPLDVSVLTTLADAIERLVKQYFIDAVVLNAGRGAIGGLENFSAAQINASLQLNLVSPMIVARSALPALRRRTRSDLVFIGSESALTGQRYGSLYSAAKFGLRGAAQALRDETSRANCHVGIVQPGMVRTAFFDHLSFEPGPEDAHALHADDVASAVQDMLNAPDHAVIDEITLRPRQHVVARKTPPLR